MSYNVYNHLTIAHDHHAVAIGGDGEGHVVNNQVVLGLIRHWIGGDGDIFQSSIGGGVIDIFEAMDAHRVSGKLHHGAFPRNVG